jgi:RNA polymerase sigma-70 factor, ECF subfamily
VEQQEKLDKFERLVLRHMDSAFNLARWFTHNEADAKDLTQEALLRAFRGFDRFQGEDGRVWLFTIIRNLFYTSISRRPPEQTSFDEEIHSAEEFSSSPEAVLLRNAETKLVRQAIEELPPEFREAMILREFEGLSYKEIATITESPLGTVMSRLARARDHLRQSLAKALKGTSGHAKEGQNAM